MGLNAAGAALSKCVFSDDRGGLAYPPPPLGVQAGTPGRASLSLTAPGPSAVAARALGQIFESTVLSRHAVHPMADAWVGWSVKWTRRFGEEWARARQLPTGKPVLSSQTADAPNSESEPLALAPA
jgi:hypothetical protein